MFFRASYFSQHNTSWFSTLNSEMVEEEKKMLYLNTKIVSDLSGKDVASRKITLCISRIIKFRVFPWTTWMGFSSHWQHHLTIHFFPFIVLPFYVKGWSKHFWRCWKFTFVLFDGKLKAFPRIFQQLFVLEIVSQNSRFLYRIQ